MREVGNAGERFAEEFLRKKGAEILARNWIGGGGELDIVCRMNETIVFVEVKTRRYGGTGAGAEAVDAVKRLRMTRAARLYLQKNRLLDVSARFDVIEITRDGLRHIEAAFSAE